MAYCSRGDLHAFGLPRGALPNPGRLIASVNTSADSLSLDVHGFEDDDPVTFRAEAGGSLPAPLVEGTTYYVVALTDSTFSVATSAGGSVIDLTSAGSASRILVIAALPVEAAIDWASRIIDDLLPAHVVPLAEPYPEVVRMTCAELAAGKLLTFTGGTSASLTAMVDAATKRLERWAKGVPIRGDNAPKAAGLASSTALPHSDPQGWRRYGGI